RCAEPAHNECKSRIQYKKVCPIHGEIQTDEIVSGHEYEKGKYVVIDPEELDRLRTPSDKMVNIDVFVAPDAVDPVYLSGQVYYLVPEGAVGGQPFNLLREGMVRENKYAVAKVVLHGKEQVVLLVHKLANASAAERGVKFERAELRVKHRPT